MAVRTFALCSLLATAAAGCSFGDDRRLGGSSVDAQQIDAPDIDAPRIDAALAPKVFEVRPSPALAIPDNKPEGVLVTFAVTGVVSTTELEVAVDISHGYPRDVVIDLLRGTTVVKTLRPRQPTNSGTTTIVDNYHVTTAELGAPINATYAVRIADVDPVITGAVNLVRLTFKTN